MGSTRLHSLPPLSPHWQVTGRGLRASNGVRDLGGPPSCSLPLRYQPALVAPIFALASLLSLYGQI